VKSKKFGFLTHYRKIKIEGINLSNILNKCIKNRIDLRNLRWNNPLESTVEIKDGDFEQFKKISGHSYKISVLGEGGIYAFFKLLKANILTVAGAFLIGALIFYQSLFIAEIRIEGYRQIPETEIRQLLASYGVKEGNRKLGNYNDVKQVMYQTFDELTWITFYEKGRLLKVKVAEAGQMQEDKKINTNPVHIVASQSGIIESILPLQGMAKVKKGDYVNEGDILISGKYKYQSTDYSKGDKEYVLYSHAEGQVLAKVPQQLTFVVEKNKRKLIPTGKILPGICIEIGDFQIDTTRQFCRFRVSKRTEHEIIDMHKYFPLKISYVKVREVTAVDEHQNMTQMKKVVEAAIRQYAKEKLNKNDRILSQEINFFESEGVIRAEVFLEIMKDIGIEKSIKIKKDK